MVCVFSGPTQKKILTANEQKTAHIQIICKASCVNLSVILNRVDDGKFWAEVPAIRSCAIENKTMNELMAYLRQEITRRLSFVVASPREGRMLHALWKSLFNGSV
jgi:hypothetical protein